MPHFKSLTAAGLLAALGACGSGGPLGTGAGAGPAADACGASGFQNLVGTSVGGLDPATLPEPRRIVFPDQSVTQDFVAERLNVEIGANDQVARVYCG